MLSFTPARAYAPDGSAVASDVDASLLVVLLRRTSIPMAPRKGVAPAGDKPKDVLSAVLLADSFTQVRANMSGEKVASHGMFTLLGISVLHTHTG